MDFPKAMSPKVSPSLVSVSSKANQWTANSRRTRRAFLLLLGFFAIILGGPVLFSAIYKALVGAKKSPNRVARSRPLAKALFDFAGESENDLPFRKDDLITIIRPVGTGWLEGELNGRVGLIPEPFVAPHIPSDRPNINPNPHSPYPPHNAYPNANVSF
jgi:hypothetical protein